MPIVMPDAADILPLEVMLQQAIWHPLSLVHLLSFTFIIYCDKGVLEYLLANTTHHVHVLISYEQRHCECVVKEQK